MEHDIFLPDDTANSVDKYHDLIKALSICDVDSMLLYATDSNDFAQQVHTRMSIVNILHQLGINDKSAVIAILLYKDFCKHKDTIQKILTKRDLLILNDLNATLDLKSKTPDGDAYVQILLSTQKNPLTLFVLLSIITHDTLNLPHSALTKTEKHAIAHDALTIYAPLAARLGIRQIHSTLQDAAFKYIAPALYNSINIKLKNLQVEKQTKIDDIANSLRNIMQNHNLHIQIEGRTKSIYSIWRKMNAKNTSIKNISDILGFRIITNTVAECYQALGIIHTKYRNKDQCFSDYISKPKINNYQSIHTVIENDELSAVEIQIRTHQMHRTAKFGFAAHWKYKAMQNSDMLQKIITLPITNTKSKAAHDKIKQYSENDAIFCFSKDGNLIAMQKNSTVLDFAFAIHSEIGKKCLSAKINDKIQPNNTKLHNGDQITIIQSDAYMVSHHWLQIAQTDKALREIRKFLSKNNPAFIKGYKLLQQSLSSIHFPYHKQNILSLLNTLRIPSFNALISNIGNNIICPKEFSYLVKYLNSSDSKSELSTNHTTPIAVKAEQNKRTYVTKCCYPIPGDEIVGHINDRSIFVHRLCCHHIMLIQKGHKAETIVPMRWNGNGQGKYIAKLYIILQNSDFAIPYVYYTISKARIDIHHLRALSRRGDNIEIMVYMHVRGKKQLEKLCAKLRGTKFIKYLSRDKTLNFKQN